MRRFGLFVVLQWCGILAFSQSPTTHPGTPQASPYKPSASLPQFDFTSRRTRQFTPSTQSWKIDPLYGLNSAQNEASAQGDMNQHFHAPTMDTSTLLAMLRPSPSILLSPSPKAKLEPIPTQWPNAKIELIPTTWPDVTVQPVTGSSSKSDATKLWATRAILR